MKKNFLFAALLLPVCILSCKKTQLRPTISSSLTIVNAINGAGTLLTNFDRNNPLIYYKTANAIDNDTYSQVSGYFGKVPLAFVQQTDTTQIVAAFDLNIERGSMQTLFLTGTLATPETVLIKDSPQIFKSADSLTGLRFVNLLTGNKSINVTITDSSAPPIVSNLNYKSATGFLSFPVGANVPVEHTYTFEFRDSLTGDLLATYTLGQLNTLIQKNVTIALVGMQDSIPTVILINNYLLDLGLT